MQKQLLVAFFLAIFLGSFLLQVYAEKPSQKPRPNVLFVLADDQRADAVGFAGNSYIRTPSLDKLAATGVRFDNAYIMGANSAAVCAPSRAMLLSGKSLFNVRTNLAGVETMPAYFGKHGYHTFGTGKWHNEAVSFKASFQEGDNVFMGGMGNHYKLHLQRLKNGNLENVAANGYSTDMFADAAIRFLESYANTKQENPFFCYVAFTTPHDPRSPRKDYIGMYPDGTIPLPGNFMDLHPFLFENFNIRDETLAPWPRTPKVIQQSLSDYYAMITHMDSRIGDIIATLKAKGLFDNTIIVYTSDNGLAVGSHGLLGKQNLYEHSIKVPLVISGPGIPKAQVKNALVYLFDLFPTIAQICYLPLPKEVNGINLSEVVNGGLENVRSSLYTVYQSTVRAVRNDEWKLICYPQRNHIQLFNLKTDPLEINNLAQLPQYKNKVIEMNDLLQKGYAQTGDTINLHPAIKLPMEYDYKKLKQIQDRFQPEYILNRYFNDVKPSN